MKLVYDSIENLYAVLAVSDGKINVYRLDHVISLKYSRERHPQKQTDLLSIVSNVWGRCFSDHPETVKVRFYKEGNVWEKVRKDLSYRSNGKIYEEDGYLYYEDVVYGINAFRNWLYGYGSSAVVLEPESLRRQIIDSLKERRDAFG